MSRRFRICTLLTLVCLAALLDAARAQDGRSADGLWAISSVDDANAIRAAVGVVPGRLRQFTPRNFKTFDLDPAAFQRIAANVPNEANGQGVVANRPNPSEITIPMPDGTYQRFGIVESSVMSPALAVKFPNIKSYRGTCVDNPRMTLRMDSSPGGLHVQVISDRGTIVVNPLGAGNQYVSFNKRLNRAGSQPFRCEVEGRAPAGVARVAAPVMPISSGEHLRTYRIAVACTGEYAERFGATKAGAMAAINTTINRVTQIYEREVAVRFQLVGNNDEILFTDPLADPFNNNSAGILIGQSQAVIDSEIGDANYDIGHTFSTGAGGLAGLGVAGVSGQKARGVTGRDDPVGDPFDVDYVCHEIGHQFGGDHTFNGVVGSCSGSNRNPATAVEPGSGSTIQAYAGICISDDLQQNSDAYFHSQSLEQIISHSTLGGGNVVAAVPTGNHPPTVDAGSDHVIPAKTPFKLTANGSDPDGDALIYCWEQRDTGPAAAVATTDDGAIPLFRSFNPTSDNHRTFPRWADILTGTATTGEQLPSKSRTMRFAVTARDARSGGGGVSSDTANVSVVDSAGPFRLTHPAAGPVPSHLVEVRWDVANTNASPINCQSVNIKLSSDGGATFTETLAAATPNDGSELVAIPATLSSNLRLLVESSDNVFFAVSPQSFAISPTNVQVYLTRHAETPPGQQDPDLLTEGAERANKLSELMQVLGISHVYSTDFRRTRQTANPTALAVGTTTNIYNDAANLVTDINLLPAGSRVLVVAHSNTVGQIVDQLGVSDTVTIAHDEFDNVFFVGLTDGQPTFQRWKFETTTSTTPRPNNDNTARPLLAANNRPASFAPPSLTLPSSRPSAQTNRFGRATNSNSVEFLEQNWSHAEAREFYTLRQGSPLMRREFFDALEQPDASSGTDLFRNSGYLESFGFLPQPHHAGNSSGYPVGFVGSKSIEFNCSACHTSKLSYGGKEYWIDGSQAMTDVGRWLDELVRAIKQTLDDAPDLTSERANARVAPDMTTRFGRFANRLVGSNPTAGQLRVIQELLDQDYDRRLRYNDRNQFGKRFANDADRAAATKTPAYGYGRIDALGAILNQACVESIGRESNAHVASAPVNFPAIWDAPQHTHVQWNGSVDNTATFGPLGRNTGQVIGVFGIVDTDSAFGGYDSSVNFDALNRAEELITKLWSPKWPDSFGLDSAKATAGKAIYQANCVSCHAEMDRTDPRRDPRDVLVPIHETFGPHGKLGTDDLAASNWQNRTAQVGLLAGRSRTIPFGGSFPNSETQEVPAREILSHLIFKSITRSFVPWRDELTIDSAPRARMFAVAARGDTLLRYKARPLNGVWSTAPYLHNGSILDIAELLTPPADRKQKFRVGTTKFDPETLGFKNEGPFELDTTLPGNGNGGHAYGTQLSDAEKLQLIEYLKTL